jgi:hypothetical protein
MRWVRFVKKGVGVGAENGDFGVREGFLGECGGFVFEPQMHTDAHGWGKTRCADGAGNDQGPRSNDQRMFNDQGPNEEGRGRGGRAVVMAEWCVRSEKHFPKPPFASDCVPGTITFSTGVCSVGGDFFQGVGSRISRISALGRRTIRGTVPLFASPAFWHRPQRVHGKNRRGRNSRPAAAGPASCWL